MKSHLDGQILVNEANRLQLQIGAANCNQRGGGGGGGGTKLCFATARQQELFPATAPSFTVDMQKPATNERTNEQIGGFCMKSISSLKHFVMS